ncbi:MAG: XdhC family protein [Anaerolineae bacterium]|nr:XdhC family protein [Anaerolineae bacterium]
MESPDILHELSAAIEEQESVTLATVVEVKGASPAQVGFKLLVRPDGSAVGNLGGGELEQRTREEAVSALREGRSRLIHYALREEGPDAVGMLCGGEVTVFVEVYQPAPTLLIVGGGHIGQPLAEMARIVGFQVQVVDVRPERATVPQLDPAAITPQTYVVLITEDHVTDEQALRQVLDTPAAYIGMIGSRRKVSIIFDHLRADGVSEERLAHIHAPIGLDLGGRSPAEIALSILAEIVQVRYDGSGKKRKLDMSSS